MWIWQLSVCIYKKKRMSIFRILNKMSFKLTTHNPHLSQTHIITNVIWHICSCQKIDEWIKNPAYRASPVISSAMMGSSLRLSKTSHFNAVLYTFQNNTVTQVKPAWAAHLNTSTHIIWPDVMMAWRKVGFGNLYQGLDI